MSLFNRLDLTDAGNVSRETLALTAPGQAHFAGSGPTGETCNSCAHWRGSCLEFARMMPNAGEIAVPPQTPACKYWSRAPDNRIARSFRLAIDDSSFRAEILSGRFLADLDRLIATGQRFDIVLADPPWKFRTFSEAGLGRGPERHYPTMTLDEIIALGPRIQALAAANCTLLLWCTWPLLARGDIHKVFDAWGFAGRTAGFDWVKLTKKGKPAIGTGYYTRANSEPCLLAVRGKPLKRMDRGVSQIILAPRRKHSQKPDETYDRIERLFGPDMRRLELFSRTVQFGWTALGTVSDQMGAT